MSKFPSSVIVYEGASQLDGQPIVLILTNLETPSQNKKTGDMVQAMVLVGQHKPTDAVKSGHDVSICGDCPLRRKTCYVNLLPINGVHKSYLEDKLPYINQAILERAREQQKKLRITAYGDPSAVPLEVWQHLLHYFTSWTGYTHQWRWLSSDWSRFLMASCETVHDVVLATNLGWSTFRVMNEGDPMLSAEIQCPNIKNSEIQCANCRLCSGSAKTERHITVPVHGLQFKVDNFAKLTSR